MPRDKALPGRAQECGTCALCGGEIYCGEFCFRLGRRTYCADCIRAGRMRAGEDEADFRLPPLLQFQ